ncbi:MAG: WecB/TagA/CpsF family glycosyltransferase [Cyanobacteria bacterium]|nr:WecB/TagA/CpsF family glycosyltransferase [Cyanobacteriota bacterium]
MPNPSGLSESKQVKKTAKLFGYTLFTGDLPGAVNVVESHLELVKALSMHHASETVDNPPVSTLHVITLNPEMIMQAQEDPALSTILMASSETGLNIPDGAGVVWALKNKGVKHIQRLPGIEFSEKLIQKAAEKNYTVGFIGAKAEVLTLAVKNLTEKYPGLSVVYQHHGFFQKESEADQIAQECANQKPDILFVALGVPRQEKWIAHYGSYFDGTVFVGVGGSLDVWSGQTQRAPYWFRKLNMEWLYRITSEPWRIKRVYKTLPLFVIKVLQSPSC